MATSDRYCHPEGISKRHLIFTYQYQPYPTGKHVSPPQNPLFNCFELSIQCCLSPPVSEGVPAPHMHSGSQMLCTAAKCNARVTCLLVRRGHGTLWLPFSPLQQSPLLLAVFKMPRQRHLPCAWASWEEPSTATLQWSPKNPLSPPLHHSLGAWDLRACPLFCTSGWRGGLAHLKVFYFLQMFCFGNGFFLLRYGDQNPIRAGTTGGKDKQSHRVFPAMLCCDLSLQDPRKLQYH